MGLLISNWKIILAIICGISVPIYFSITSDKAVKNMESALQSSQESNKKQLQVLQNSLEEQRIAYDKMFKDYQIKMAKLEEDYQKDLKKVADKQIIQQKQLTDRFADPKAVDEELEKRFGLKK
jgi:sucrose-6-phosphate hydrolase SacC (GH32 family)